MLSRIKVTSAMLGLAMLALPASALAGHHHDGDDQGRPYAWHDQGWHNGWAKHRDRDDFRPACQGRRYYQPQQSQPFAWHHEPDADDYYSANRGYSGGNGYNYDGLANGNANGNPSQQLASLTARRQQALVTMNRLRAQHDSRGAGRMATQIQNLNNQIARLNGGRANSGYGYGSGYLNSYVPATNYVVPVNPYAAQYGSGYNPYYGNTAPYYGNSNLSGLTSLVGPLLGLPH